MLSEYDRAFISRMMRLSIGIHDISTFASAASEDDRVREMAATAVREQTALQSELRQIASDEGALLPDGPDTDHQKVRGALSTSKPEELNRAYRATIASDAREMIGQFEMHRGASRSPRLNQFVDRFLPVIRRTERRAEEEGGAAAGNEARPEDRP